MIAPIALRSVLRPVSLAALLFLAGCNTPGYTDPARQGPFFIPTNHSGVKNLPAALKRVVVLPVSGGDVTTPEMAASFDPIFTAALGKENRFEVVSLGRDELRRKYGVEEMSSTAALPQDFLTALGRDHAADAVLFLDLIALQTHRPLRLGVRGKLAAVADAQLLWNFDQVFSAADAAVANSARRHLLLQDRSAAPADMSPAVLQSPSKFAGYVAAAAFATLPPVYSPAKIDSGSR